MRGEEKERRGGSRCSGVVCDVGRLRCGSLILVKAGEERGSEGDAQRAWLAAERLPMRGGCSHAWMRLGRVWVGGKASRGALFIG